MSTKQEQRSVSEQLSTECVSVSVGEPVAWQWLNTAHFRKKLPKDAEKGAWNPLYTTPQPAQKPLTDEQIDKAMAENKQILIDAADDYWKMRRAYARIIEAAHGIKEST